MWRCEKPEAKVCQNGTKSDLLWPRLDWCLPWRRWWPWQWARFFSSQRQALQYFCSIYLYSEYDYHQHNRGWAVFWVVLTGECRLMSVHGRYTCVYIYIQYMQHAYVSSYYLKLTEASSFPVLLKCTQVYSLKKAKATSKTCSFDYTGLYSILLSDFKVCHNWPTWANSLRLCCDYLGWSCLSSHIFLKSMGNMRIHWFFQKIVHTYLDDATCFSISLLHQSCFFFYLSSGSLLKKVVAFFAIYSLLPSSA